MAPFLTKKVAWIEKSQVREFLKNKLLLNLAINLAINLIVPAVILYDHDRIPFLQGNPSVASSWGPLFFLLPFFVSLDTVDKYVKLLKRNDYFGQPAPTHWTAGRVWKKAFLNGLMVLSIGTIIFSSILFLYPPEPTLDSTWVILMNGCFSAILAFLYTYIPLYQLNGGSPTSR